MNQSKKTRIAHLAGPTATIQNTPPLVTSNKARAKHGLPLLKDADGAPLRHDALRPQRLAAPAKVYVEQFSAHPLESDVAELYGPPDGYIGADGVFRKERQSASDKPVYEIELKPEDGLYPLPYMAMQADGTAWEEECTAPGAPHAAARASSPTARAASRRSIACRSASTAPRACCPPSQRSTSTAACRRAASPRVCRRICAATRARATSRRRSAARISSATSPITSPSAPPRPALAKATNDMQALVSSGDYDGVIWTQGSPQVEESAYWFNLLIDTTLPICGNAAQRPQGQISADGPANIVDSARFIRSRVWADEQGRNRCGVVVIQEQQMFAAREVAKADARPGGYVATGGHGGIIGNISHTGRIALTYLPVFKHTYSVGAEDHHAAERGEGGEERPARHRDGRRRGQGRQRQAPPRRHSGRHHLDRRQLLRDGLRTRHRA